MPFSVPQGANASGGFRDEFHRIAEGLDGLGCIIGDFDAELFFECHDQFDRVERVRAQVVDERGRFRYRYILADG